ncbi:MAG: N-acetylmuramoyl-L-alanine amidase [Pseudomonadota bacterium]
MDRIALGKSLNLWIDLIAQGSLNRPGRSLAPAFITIHNTSNTSAGADASAHARFVTKTEYYTLSSGKKNPVSWHFTVDDERVIKHLPLNEVGYHAKSGNAVSIGIEICMHQGIDQSAADARAARLVAVLMHDLGIPPANVVTHKYWTTKSCPTLLLSSFDEFVSTASKNMASLTEDGTEGAQATDDVVTAEERERIRELEEAGAESITPLPEEVLEADDPHPGSLLVGDVTTGSGV